jgi:hypothetical protein
MFDVVAGVCGVLLVLLIASDLFQSVIVPRPANWLRPSAVIGRLGWRIAGAIGVRIRSEQRREAFFGVYAPALMLALMVYWIAGLTFGFGLIFFALRAGLRPAPENFWGALYYAGTSFLTLGYGDIVARHGIGRAISLAAAAIGLATFSILTAFLFSTFGAFQRREAFIVALRERTGAPPSGVDFIERYVELDMLADLAPTFRSAEAWMGDLIETHLAYPVLSYFRSTHDDQSWVGTLGALLDAATILITTVDLGNIGPAKMLSRLGRHLVRDYADYYGLVPGQATGIERAEFDQAYERLRSRGVPMRELEQAWTEFAALRGSYAFPLNALARWWRIPPARWIGDRSLIPTRHAAMPPAKPSEPAV